MREDPDPNLDPCASVNIYDLINELAADDDDDVIVLSDTDEDDVFEILPDIGSNGVVEAFGERQDLLARDGDVELDESYHDADERNQVHDTDRSCIDADFPEDNGDARDFNADSDELDDACDLFPQNKVLSSPEGKSHDDNSKDMSNGDGHNDNDKSQNDKSNQITHGDQYNDYKTYDKSQDDMSNDNKSNDDSPNDVRSNDDCVLFSGDGGALSQSFGEDQNFLKGEC